MIEVVKFKKEHLTAIRERNTPFFLKEHITPAQIVRLEQREHSYTVLSGDKVLACAGIVEHWAGRGETWALIDGYSRDSFMTLHNVVKRFLDIHRHSYRRLEAVVDCDFPEGHRWVNSLGFKKECSRMKNYSVTGADCSLYVMIGGH